MKRLLAIALCIMLFMSGCGEDVLPQSGNYYAQGDYAQYACPYVYINPEDGSFVTCAGALISYAEVGEFTIDGDQLMAETLSCRFVFEIEDENTLILQEFSSYTPYDMHQGMTFVLSQELQ